MENPICTWYRNKQTKFPDFFKDPDGNKITDSNKIANNLTGFFLLILVLN